MVFYINNCIQEYLLLCYYRYMLEMKAILILFFMIVNEPAVILTKGIYIETRAVCEIAEGMWNKPVTGYMYPEDQLLTSFKGEKLMFIKAKCKDVPVPSSLSLQAPY